MTLECRNQWPNGDQPGLADCRIVKAGFPLDAEPMASSPA
ncbi:conserved hypothethical protein (plasmid) [Ralstonia solanacearum CMR15]|nr:conserved hypothethical protein [Ralstonia solanacearum CMR15]